MRGWIKATVGGLVLAASITAGSGLITADLSAMSSRPTVIDTGESHTDAVGGSLTNVPVGEPVLAGHGTSQAVTVRQVGDPVGYVALNRLFPPTPLPRFPWPVVAPTLAVSIEPGKGPASGGVPSCDMLIVVVSGANFPSDIDSGVLDFYDSRNRLIWTWHYDWNLQGPSTQTLGDLAGDWLITAAGGDPALRVDVRGATSISTTFTLNCAASSSS